MTKIIFVPGNSGSTTHDNWFPDAKSQLEDLGLDVIATDFPDPKLARMSHWLPFLKDQLEACKDSILIGHSSGAIAAMRYAEKHFIKASFLVGAYHTDLGIEQEKLSGYFDQPWEWSNIRENQEHIALFASADDPWIPIGHPRFIHEKLNCEYHEFVDKGHFGGDYFKPHFPELVLAIKSFLKIE